MPGAAVTPRTTRRTSHKASSRNCFAAKTSVRPLSRRAGCARFFKTAFRNFIADEVRRQTRQKRGGSTGVFSLDIESAERHYEQTLRDEAAPEDAFDRLWARTILRRTLGALRKKFRDRGRSETWRELEVFLGPDEAAPAYAEVAAKLGQTENTIAAAVRRMRQEFRDMLREEVADTLAAGEDVDEELRYLLRLAW